LSFVSLWGFGTDLLGFGLHGIGTSFCSFLTGLEFINASFNINQFFLTSKEGV